MRRACAVLLVLAACPRAGGTVDAGLPVERATDLRTALQLIFPEYRGVRVLSSSARVTRVIAPATASDLEKAKASAAANGFSGDPLSRAPFTMALTPQGESLVLTLSMPISESDVGRIYAAPAAMGTESMANWLPKLDVPWVSEAFDLELSWQELKPGRASFVVWQLVDGLRSGGWSANLPGSWTHDGGAASVPDDVTLTLAFERLGATIDLKRQGGDCTLHYHLVTRERR